MYNESAIKYIKSITRNSGNDWAYMEYGVGDIFELRFPNNPVWYPTNYQKARPNELIVLFQTLVEGPGRLAGSYVTHLVTPVDTIVEYDQRPDHPYKRYVCAVGRTDPAYRVDLAEWSFYKPNRGQIVDIVKIERRQGDDYTVPQKQRFIWEMFNDINASLDVEVDKLQHVQMEVEPGTEEGAEVVFLKLHRTKERDPGVIAEAKRWGRQEGRFFCEACTFNFETEYPILGDGFIECHHRLPIATGGIRTTRVLDLALVCSNCHRMLHRKYNGGYLTVEQLRDMVLAVNR
jgi:hypothetical protein